MDELHFEGDPATDSTRRQLERVLRNQPRRRWPWLAALAAGGTAMLWWHVRKRRQNGASGSGNGKARTSEPDRAHDHPQTIGSSRT